MKNFKKIATAGAIAIAIGATSITGFASSTYKTPADVAAGVTEKSVESIMTERQETNKSFGTIAAEAGKLEEFKKESIEMKKDNLETQVKEGKITQEKADTIIKAIEEKQVDCDGRGSERIGRKEGARFGSNGLGQGLGNKGQGKGQGQGRGQGRGQGGMRLQDGSCEITAK